MTRVKTHLHDLVISQFNLAQNISDFYKEKRLQYREVEKFKVCYNRILSSYWNTFVSKIPIETTTTTKRQIKLRVSPLNFNSIIGYWLSL